MTEFGTKEFVVDHTPVNLHAYEMIKERYNDAEFNLVIREPFTTIRGLAVRWANPFMGGQSRGIEKIYSRCGK